jgi:hypothetical protein
MQPPKPLQEIIPVRRENMSPVVAETVETEESTLAWGAVIAGAVVAAALTLLLAALGVGLGLSVVSPWSDQGVSATTFHVGAGLYLLATAMLASTVGGYVAGRLRVRWLGLNEKEVYFRDTAHGLATWALATVLSASVLGGAVTHLLAGVATGAGAAAASSTVNPVDNYVDTLLRADPARGATAAAGPSGAAGAQATHDEMARILTPVLRSGSEISAANRTYAAQVVAARTGLPQAEAERRVTEVVTEVKKAADETRKATMKLTLWLAASMLAGAVAAMLGAVEGGFLRDEKWYEPGWRGHALRSH